MDADESSGLIDLNAIERRAREHEARLEAPPSEPPGAVTTEIGDNDEYAESLAPNWRRRSPVFVGIGIATTLLIVGLALVAGATDPPKAAAAAAAAAPPPPAPAPPAPAPAPPPVVRAADSAPAASPAPAAAAPSPETHAKPTTATPHVAKGHAPAAKSHTASGPKLQKVHSAGVAPTAKKATKKK